MITMHAILNRISVLLFSACLLSLLMMVTGCSSATNPPYELSEEEVTADSADTTVDSVMIAELYRDIYEQASSEQRLGSLEMIQSIVNRLGEHGYAALDTENHNQVNMTHPELLEQFCGLVEENGEGNAMFFCVSGGGGFVRFDLKTSDGQVMVTRSVLCWSDGEPEISYMNSYPAEGWKYSENGYLFFEEALPSGYDGAVGYTAVRVQPLEEKCRECNRRYILPVGYGSNNLFLSDWSEPDFQGVDFDDMFALLYASVMGVPIPYEKTVDGEEYLVPEAVYEKVIGSYFAIDNVLLRGMAEYSQQKEGYEYSTRNFLNNSNSPNIPYPEVVDCRDGEAGTLILTVNAVWPQKHLEKAFSHEVTIRPDNDGGFCYVSNHVISSVENVEPEWYTEKASTSR